MGAYLLKKWAAKSKYFSIVWGIRKFDYNRSWSYSKIDCAIKMQFTQLMQQSLLSAVNNAWNSENLRSVPTQGVLGMYRLNQLKINPS